MTNATAADQTEREAAPRFQLASLAATSGKVLAIIPSNLDQIWRMAKAIAMAGWAPKGYANKEGVFDVEKIAVGIMHGMEVGFTPIAALQSIAVINGMPSIYGDGALALVLSSGLMEDFKETPVTNEKGVVVGYKFWAKRRGRATPIEQQFLLADAQRAGLIGKVGPWTQYETRMFQMRARAWGLRDGFADVLRGLGIAEEVLDIGPTPERDITPTTPAIEGPRSKSESTAEAQVASVVAQSPAVTGPGSEPASSATQSAAPATQSKPDVNGKENGGAAHADTPLKPSQVNVIRAKMKGPGLTELGFGSPVSGQEPRAERRQGAFQSRRVFCHQLPDRIAGCVSADAGHFASLRLERQARSGGNFGHQFSDRLQPHSTREAGTRSAERRSRPPPGGARCGRRSRRSLAARVDASSAGGVAKVRRGNWFSHHRQRKDGLPQRIWVWRDFGPLRRNAARRRFRIRRCEKKFHGWCRDRDADLSLQARVHRPGA